MGHMREMHGLEGMDPSILEAAAKRREERKRSRAEIFGESWSAKAQSANIVAQTEAPEVSVLDRKRECSEALAAKLRRNPHYLVAMEARKATKARKKAEWERKRKEGGGPAYEEGGGELEIRDNAEDAVAWETEDAL